MFILYSHKRYIHVPNVCEFLCWDLSAVLAQCYSPGAINTLMMLRHRSAFLAGYVRPRSPVFAHLCVETWDLASPCCMLHLPVPTPSILSRVSLLNNLKLDMP